jgi:hypothetical protein
MARGQKTGGRKKGTPNKTTQALKEAVLEAAALAGDKDGLVGYLKTGHIESGSVHGAARQGAPDADGSFGLHRHSHKGTTRCRSCSGSYPLRTTRTPTCDPMRRISGPATRVAPHHLLITEKLEAVERGEITRLMITMPPRHGKSMLASEYFPAWYLGRNPSHYVIAATYAQELADDFGRKVRNQIADPAFNAIFPGVALKSDSTSSRRFHVTQPLDSFSTGQNGAYFAVGVGGPLTGRGAHLLLIDDPVKNREEADSELIRKKTKDWYTSTAYTR